MPDKVELYVYDLSNGLARSLSMPLAGIQIDGIWHTSIVLRSREIYYGQGIQEVSPPGTTHHGRPVKVVDLGETELEEETFEEYLNELRDHYRADKYHLLDFNCNSFTADVAAFLTGNTIPTWISNLPAEFLSTPFGQSLRPQIDAMFSPQRTASNPQGLNGLANTDIASTLLSHVAAAASQPPAPTQTPAASAAQGALSSTLHLATSPTSLRELLDTHPVVIANFTNPKTCPPCRAIAPHFERLASLRSSELAGKDVAFVDVDLGVGLGSAAAQEWRVSATPTFVFFLKGAKTDELKGANARELENAVDRWLWQAFPPHPHASLPLPAIKAISTTPILYSQTPNWTSLLGKLLPSVDSLTLPSDQKAAVKTFFEQDVVPFLQTKTLPQGKNLETLITSFVGHTELLKAHLPLDQVFPVFDLWRVAILDPKVCSLATISTPTSSSAGLLKICTDVVADSPSDVSLPRPYLLTILRLIANCFSFLPLAVLFVSPTSTSRTAFTTFLVDSLLSEDEHTKSAAAAIAFNVASVRHRVHDHRGMKPESAGEEEGDWVLEVVFAVLEAIKVEEKKEDVLYRLVAALALLLYKSPYYTTELAPNLEVLGARAVLEGKLGLVSKKEVRGLVQEVAGQLS